MVSSSASPTSARSRGRSRRRLPRPARGLALTYPSERLEEKRPRACRETRRTRSCCRATSTSDQQIADLAATLDREFGGLDFMPCTAPASRRPMRCTIRSSRRRARASGSRSTSAPIRSSALTRAVAAADGKRGGGSILTLTYLGSDRVFTNYNVMGVAKARARVVGPLPRERPRPEEHPRQRDFGRGRSRRSPPRVLPGSRHPAGDRDRAAAAERRMSEVADAALFLLSPASRAVTGEILMVDAGMHAIGILDPGSRLALGPDS